MGFEINGGFNKPVIKESQQAHDGGAGNLGYFEQGEKDKKEKDKSIFSDAKESDTFVKEGAEEDFSDDFSISKILAQIILAVKDWFKKIFNS